MKPSRILSCLKKPFHVILSCIHWVFLRLELLSSIHHNRKEHSEPPKQITQYSRCGTAGIFATQLLPIAVSSTLLYINFSNVYFEPPGVSNQNARLNSLQFAAKMHEVLITISLSAMVLHYIQYELLHGRGIPLGSLLASFQVTYLGTLWSPGLWATSSADISRVRRLLLTIFIVLALLIGATVGPASAILMVPSLDYWTHSLGATASMGFPGTRYFIGTNTSTLWTNTISTTSFPVECNSTASPAPEYCPLGGFSVLWDLGNCGWALGSCQWALDGVWDISMPTTTPTLDVYHHYIKGGTVSSYYGGSEFVNVAMTTPLFAGSILRAVLDSWGQGQEMENGKVNLAMPNGPLLAPVVYSSCNTTEYTWINGELWEWVWDSDSGFRKPGPKLSTIAFPMMSTQENWSVDASNFLSIWKNTTQSAALWVEPTDMGSITPSIGAIYASLDIDVEDGNSTNYTIDITSCSVFAAWQPIDIYMNISTDYEVYSPIVDGSMPRLLDLTQDVPLKPQEAIKIDVNWATLALPPNETFGELSRKMEIGDPAYNPHNLSNIGASFPINEFSIATTILFADVMSRIGLDAPDLIYIPAQGKSTSSPAICNPIRDASYVGFGDLTDASDASSNNCTVIYYTENNMTELRITRIRYGYVYSMDGLTRRVAAGIFIVHAFIAVVYMTLVMWFGWNCYSLRSLIEILVVAINSQPTEKLNNTCAGVSRLDTYKHVIKVREVSNSRVGFVFDDGESWNIPVPEKLYGEIISKEVQMDESENSATDEVEEIHSVD